jgi:hypothetical protein
VRSFPWLPKSQFSAAWSLCDQPVFLEISKADEIQADHEDCDIPKVNLCLAILRPLESLTFGNYAPLLVSAVRCGQVCYRLHKKCSSRTIKRILLIVYRFPLMNRTLSDLTHSEGNIASGKCTACGQRFTTSADAPAAGDTEWEVVGAFGGHECTPVPSA